MMIGKWKNLTCQAKLITAYSSHDNYLPLDEDVLTMAIFFPIKCIERHEALVVLEFSAARKEGYVTQGQVYVDLITQEIELVETYTSEAENIFIPIKGAIKRELQNGKIPDEFAYAA